MDRFRQFARKVGLVAVGPFSLPMLLFGGYLLVCWILTHTFNLYYVNYPYLATGLIWIAVGVASLLVTLYATWRRSFYGSLFAVPLFACLVSLVIIPDAFPHLSVSMMADTNYLGSVRAFLSVWYDAHHSFPVNESEFR